MNCAGSVNRLDFAQLTVAVFMFRKSNTHHLLENIIVISSGSGNKMEIPVFFSDSDSDSKNYENNTNNCLTGNRFLRKHAH